MTSRDPLPPNQLIVPVAIALADSIMDNPASASRLIRRSVWFITPADSVDVLSVTRSDGPTSLLDLLTIEFTVRTPEGRSVYCSPIDFTSNQPRPEPMEAPV